MLTPLYALYPDQVAIIYYTNILSRLHRNQYKEHVKLAGWGAHDSTRELLALPFPKIILATCMYYATAGHKTK